MKEKIKDWIEKPLVSYAIIVVIVINAITLGMETSKFLMDRAGAIILLIDRICLTIFVLEILLKLYVFGGKFFRTGWNNFDFLIVSIALLPSGEGLSVLRALRVLRVFRVISVAPRLRRVVEGFVTALPGMGSVFLLMAIIFYIGSVMATKLFGDTFPEWFGTLGASAYSLFQIMTLESWSMGIVRPVMITYPYAWLFFVPFIMVTTFAVVNLLVGLIVNSMQEAHSEESVAATESYRDEVLKRLDAIENNLNSK
ncbi:MAG: ion transporter [Aestuariivita sp.]|nr:ion transporter [Aestuariivita sp.]